MPAVNGYDRYTGTNRYETWAMIMAFAWQGKNTDVVYLVADGSTEMSACAALPGPTLLVRAVDSPDHNTLPNIVKTEIKRYKPGLIVGLGAVSDAVLAAAAAL